MAAVAGVISPPNSESFLRLLMRLETIQPQKPFNYILICNINSKNQIIFDCLKNENVQSSLSSPVYFYLRFELRKFVSVTRWVFNHKISYISLGVSRQVCLFSIKNSQSDKFLRLFQNFVDFSFLLI